MSDKKDYSALEIAQALLDKAKGMIKGKLEALEKAEVKCKPVADFEDKTDDVKM